MYLTLKKVFAKMLLNPGIGKSLRAERVRNEVAQGRGDDHAQCRGSYSQGPVADGAAEQAV
jgi:hypothetical protein